MMTLTVHMPLGFTQIGQRENNEDAVYPPLDQAGEESCVFLVCDGVGGAVNGEIASRLVADQMAAYFNIHPGPSNEETVSAALQSAETALDAYRQKNPLANGMATTMTLLHLHDDGATIAHVGDSRVYVCRNGQIHFQTEDHSLVNEWVKRNILTPEQAIDHPQRNVITRAVSGGAKPAKADVMRLNDLQPDDYFFLCTDGVLETLRTEELVHILNTTDSDSAKLMAIRQGCDDRTQDNYSAYLVHIHSVVVR